MSKKSDAIKALRAVAEGHYNKTLPARAKQAGLCWASGYAYEAHSMPMNAVYATVELWTSKHTPHQNMYLCKPGTRWNQRAMFALLLAESMA